MRRTQILSSIFVLLAALLVPLAAYPTKAIFTDFMDAAHKGDTAAVLGMVSKGGIDVNGRDEDGRKEVAKALGRLGPEAKAALPALIEASRDEG